LKPNFAGESPADLAPWSLPLMFDWSLDPRSQLALLCLLTAFVFWNNDILFFLFATLALCTRVFSESY
jgi:hypothetical protein